LIKYSNDDEAKQSETEKKIAILKRDREFRKATADVLGVKRSQILLAQAESTRSTPAFYVLQLQNEIVVSIRGTASVHVKTKSLVLVFFFFLYYL
jgi:hypothetical protein